MMKALLMVHLYIIKIISHVSFPYCLEVLLKPEEERKRKDIVKSWDMHTAAIFSTPLGFSPVLCTFKPKRSKLPSIIMPILLPLQPRRLTNKQHGFLCECSYGLSLLNVSGWAGEASHPQQPFISTCRTAHI